MSDDEIMKAVQPYWSRADGIMREELIDRLRARVVELEGYLERYRIDAASCACRFDEDERPVIICDYHKTVMAENARLRAELEADGAAPIARLTVDDSGLVVRAGLYAPGLPVGDHDVWCVPVSERESLALLDAECASLKAERDDWRRRAETNAEDPLMARIATLTEDNARLRAALEAVVKYADAHPFTIISHVIEHGGTGAREALK